MIWVVLIIVAAMVANIGMSCNTGLTAKKDILEHTINSLQGVVPKSDMEELKDMRKHLQTKTLGPRVLFTCMWWGGVILFGVSLWMLTHR